MYRIDEHTKHVIVTLKEQGNSSSHVAEELGISRNTVDLWWKIWQEEGAIVKHVSYGRPRKTSREQDEQLITGVRNQRFMHTSLFAAELSVSKLTVRRRLKEAGLHYRQPARKPFLNDRHKMLRLNFANRYLQHNFDNVAFMDEKVFVSDKDGRILLYRTNNTRYNEENILPNRRNGRISCAFWGWMNSAGPIEICEVTGRMSGADYVDVLKDVFVPTAKIVYPDGHRIEFIQDGSPVHNARRVQEWIAQQEDLVLIKLPPRSPDLNPIENLWGLMAQNWDSTRVRSVANLKAHVHEIWEGFRSSTACSNMIASMRERLQNVIDANGGYTRF